MKNKNLDKDKSLSLLFKDKAGDGLAVYLKEVLVVRSPDGHTYQAEIPADLSFITGNVQRQVTDKEADKFIDWIRRAAVQADKEMKKLKISGAGKTPFWMNN